MRKFYAYAFGVPLILTTATFIVDFNSKFLPNLRYMIPIDASVIEINVIGRFVSYLVSYLVLITNVFFFAGSAWNIYKVHREIARMKANNAQSASKLKEMKAR